MEQEQVIIPQNPFSKDSWADTAPVATQEPIDKIPDGDKPPVDTPPIDDRSHVDKVPDAAPVFDENKWVKDNWGFDSTEVAKTEIEKLKNKKDFEFANEDSRKYFDYIKEGKEDELYNVIHTKKTVEKLLNADLSDKKIATELVKFGIQNENKDLTPDEVDYLYEQKFGLPEKPIQKDDEDDDDFKLRQTAYDNKVSNIERGLVIEAKLAKPKLEKFKTELVLPDIPKGEVSAPQPTQEELQKVEEARNKILSKIESDSRNFNGFEVRYKDEGGEIPINYIISDEQRTANKEQLKNFDVHEFIGTRWFKDGEPDVNAMMQDITLLKERDAIFQKLVNETGAQIRKQYIGIKANVSVNGEQSNGIQDNSQKSDYDKQVEFIWNQK